MDNHNQQQQPVTIFKRQQHNLKLTNVLNNMLQCCSLIDVTIYCDDGEVTAHKLVLAASSNYFRNLFSRITNAFHYPIIVLREIPANDLRTILQFIYHGEIHIPQNRVESLMRCANYLQIDGMASSTNALNAVLATSTIPHHTLLTSSVSVISNPTTNQSMINNNNTNNPIAITNTGNTSYYKSHPQYITPTNTNCTQINTKQSSKAHSSRTNINNNNHNNVNNTLINSNGNINNNNGNNNSSGKPRHTCPTCFKTFTHGFTLKRHMKLHSERRATYHCEVCSKDYSCKDSYLRHKKSSNHMQHAEFNSRNNLSIGSES